MTRVLPGWHHDRPARPTHIQPLEVDGTAHRISVIILCRNEAENITAVLEIAAPFADKVLVVDGHITFNQFVRLFGSQIITLRVNDTPRVSLTDCQKGFRAIRRNVALALDLREDMTTIEQAMIIKTLRHGYRLVEVASHTSHSSDSSARNSDKSRARSSVSL